MKTERSVLISAEAVAPAWVSAIEALVEPGVEALSPLVIDIQIFDEIESQLLGVPEVRTLVDKVLANRRTPSTGATANTIFPSFWNPERPRQELYERYKRLLPKLRKEPRNRYGIYFARLIDFNVEGRRLNQLEHIIATYLSGNHRKSALQASILNPLQDLTNQRRRDFPCLQQVSFSPDPVLGLSLTGYYATQYVGSRGYGNYLGLTRLGRFVAKEIGVPLRRITCVAARACLGDGWTKASTRNELRALRDLLPADRLAKASAGARRDSFR